MSEKIEATKKVIAHIKELLELLPTDEDRLEAISEICRFCGRDNPHCNCTNDE